MSGVLLAQSTSVAVTYLSSVSLWHILAARADIQGIPLFAGHRLGLPRAGTYKQVLNTDHEKYCGGGFGVVKSIKAEKVPAHGLEYSAEICLPPLGTMWFEGQETNSHADQS